MTNFERIKNMSIEDFASEMLKHCRYCLMMDSHKKTAEEIKESKQVKKIRDFFKKQF